MTKLEKHIVKMAKKFKGVQFFVGGKFFTFNMHQIIEMEGFVEGLEKRGEGDEYHTTLERTLYYELYNRDSDFICSEWIDTKEMRAIIKKIGGTRRDVSWSNGDITINARMLVEALDALNAHTFFYDINKAPKCGAIIFKDDDVESICKEMILPQIGYDKVGYYVQAPNKKPVFKGLNGELDN